MVKPALVTPAEVMEHLNLIEASVNVDYLLLLIVSAEEAVSRYVQGNVRENGEVHQVVRMAILLLVAEHYYRREGEAAKSAQYGYLPPAVTNLLYPLRRPVAR